MNRLYSDYPGVAGVAETFGFNYDDIDSYINLIEQSVYRDLLYTRAEVALKALIIKLNATKETFEQKIVGTFYKPLDEIREIVGIQLVPLIFILYYKI